MVNVLRDVTYHLNNQPGLRHCNTKIKQIIYYFFIRITFLMLYNSMFFNERVMMVIIREKFII